MSAEWMGRCLLVTVSSGLVYLVAWMYIVPLVPLLGPLFPPQHWALIVPSGLFVSMIAILGSFAVYVFLRDAHPKSA